MSGAAFIFPLVTSGRSIEGWIQLTITRAIGRGWFRRWSGGWGDKLMRLHTTSEEAFGPSLVRPPPARGGSVGSLYHHCQCHVSSQLGGRETNSLVFFRPGFSGGAPGGRVRLPPGLGPGTPLRLLPGASETSGEAEGVAAAPAAAEDGRLDASCGSVVEVHTGAQIVAVTKVATISIRYVAHGGGGGGLPGSRGKSCLRPRRALGLSKDLELRIDSGEQHRLRGSTLQGGFVDSPPPRSQRHVQPARRATASSIESASTTSGPN
jgi:hypothetical protein